MFGQIAREIEQKRRSKRLFWKIAVVIKDFIYFYYICDSASERWLKRLKEMKAKIRYCLFLNKLDKDGRENMSIIQKTGVAKNKDKINLTDFTFIIPFKYDCNEREKNLNFIIKYLKSFFNTNIIVGEEGGERRLNFFSENVEHLFFPSENPFFHRTKILNKLTRRVKTKFLVNYDLDVLSNPADIFYGAQILRRADKDIVFPHNRECIMMTREKSESAIKKIDFFKIYKTKNYLNTLFPVYGGAVMENKKKFIACGMENENFVSWGPEDVEREYRLKKLGLKIGYTIHPLIHLYHPGDAEKKTHAHYKKNIAELSAIKKMGRDELRRYIKQWKWIN